MEAFGIFLTVVMALLVLQAIIYPFDLFDRTGVPRWKRNHPYWERYHRDVVGLGGYSHQYPPLSKLEVSNMLEYHRQRDAAAQQEKEDE